MAVTTIPTAGIADTAISTAKIADDAVGNTKLNLASDYAFTGTITGVPSGLNKITSYTIPSSTSEFNLNGIFTTTYDHYMILASGLGVTSSGGYWSIRLNQASDNSHITSNYVNTSLAYGGGTTGAQRSGGSWRLSNATTQYAVTSGEQAPMIQLTVFAPFLSMPTKFSNFSHYRDSGNSAWYTEMNMGHNTDNTSVGGLNFVADSGQNAATSEVSAITVYGIQK